ncbi:DnaT-like ssDNA-binding protein [Ponticoccus litoralis]|uniref:DnaT-like ssDNA-binding protein n=1 Tax=Ponticoccus litoralis TaxID=422297 RepID=A0AAW9S586_9RHOB
MALTVETGAGLPDADALVSLAYVDAHHEAQGNAGWAGEDAAKEAAIRRASRYLSNSYRWQGYKLRARAQSLAWPRSGVVDDEGNGIPSEEVPDEVKQACAEIALRELEAPGAMTPDYTPSERIKAEKFGPVSFEYDMSRTDAESVRPVLLIVRDLIGPLLSHRGGSRLAGSAVRG